MLMDKRQIQRLIDNAQDEAVEKLREKISYHVPSMIEKNNEAKIVLTFEFKTSGTDVLMDGKVDVSSQEKHSQKMDTYVCDNHPDMFTDVTVSMEAEDVEPLQLEEGEQPNDEPELITEGEEAEEEAPKLPVE